MQILKRLFQTNVLLVVLIVLIAVSLLGANRGSTPYTASESYGSVRTLSKSFSNAAIGMAPQADSLAAPIPTTGGGGSDRMVVSNTYLSVVVKNVAEALTGIQQKITSLGGYMVESELSQPEGAANGSLTVRVPTGKRDEALAAIRDAGVKTTSENVVGQDVTDEYTDNKARLDVLMATKAKFQKILDGATSVQDLLTVQRELINLQSQIDSVTGQQKYLEQNANLTKITVYLSTDEFSLPYAPDQPWRPEVVFKQAVRSMVGTARSGINVLIWIAAYLPIIIPVGAIVWFVRRLYHR
jgi:hypothetical protein